jgi:hypothetical protein
VRGACIHARFDLRGSSYTHQSTAEAASHVDRVVLWAVHVAAVGGRRAKTFAAVRHARYAKTVLIPSFNLWPLVTAGTGAPLSMKMGAIRSPRRYDMALKIALRPARALIPGRMRYDRMDPLLTLAPKTKRVPV